MLSVGAHCGAHAACRPLTGPCVRGPVVYPVGMMMLGLVVLSVPFYLARQTQLIAMIIVGGFVGLMEFDTTMGLSTSTAAALYELGILFLLFMAGMEVDLQAVMKAWQLILVNGMGHICTNFGVFFALAMAAFKSEGASTVSLVYFSLCCTLSSTIMVLGCLKKRGEMETMHGQIILGIMVLQDITAVFALAIITAFDPSVTKGPPIGQTVGYLIMWFAILLMFLIFLNKFVLDRLFRFFAVSSEMLFIVTFAYSLGVSSMFGHFLPNWVSTGNCCGGFNQELSIFFAGVSIAALPYRVQIETFVEPIKAFGVVLFFFILGIDLPLKPVSQLTGSLPWGFGLALLTVFVFPSIMWLLGLISGVDSKVAYLIGSIINQISEFSLIIAAMANGMGIFSKSMYLTIVTATITAFILSGCGHGVIDSLYEKVFKIILWPLDKFCRVKPLHEESFEMKQHVVLLGFNEIGMEIAEYFRREHGQDVLCVQLDPALHEKFKSLFKLNAAKAAKESGTGAETKVFSNIFSQYADPNNPDTWHHYELVKRAACSEGIVAGGSLTCFVSASRKAGGFVPAGNNRVRLCSCQGIEGS